MSHKIEEAHIRAAGTKGHRFDITDGSIVHEKSSSKSPSGLYYVDCQNPLCGRSVFENGTGTALTSFCNR